MKEWLRNMLPGSRGKSPEKAPVAGARPLEVSFVARHSVKPKGEDKESQDYPGISEKGVGLAKERGADFLNRLDRSPAGTVLFIGGASELPRTGSTGEVFGDEMQELAKDREDVLVITRSEIQEAGAPEGYTKAVAKIAERIAENPDKKVVVNFPLFVKGLSASSFVEKDGKTMKPYFVKLGEKHSTEFAQIQDWINTAGFMEEEGLQGPVPAEIAQGIEDSLRRLREFAQKNLGDRPLVVGMVGHSWFADVFLLQAALGKIDVEGLERMTGGNQKQIQETETGYITIQGDTIKVNYRGQTYERPLSAA